MTLLSFADRVQESATNVGSGTVTLQGASAPGLRTFLAANLNAKTVPYRIEHRTSGQWEVGYGVYLSSGTSLTRVAVLSNSSGTTSPINFAAGVVDVANDFPADKIVALDADTNALHLPGALTVATSITATTLTGALAWSNVTGAPTTLAGYGITDAASDSELTAAIAAVLAATAPAAGPFPFAGITGLPSTLAGHGITNAYTKTESDARYLGVAGTITFSQISDATSAATGITKVGTITTGGWGASVIGVLYGGTGLNGAGTGEILYGSALNTWSRLAPNATATRMFLSSTSSAVPAWAQVSAADLAAGTFAGAFTFSGAVTFGSSVVYNGGVQSGVIALPGALTSVIDSGGIAGHASSGPLVNDNVARRGDVVSLGYGSGSAFFGASTAGTVTNPTTLGNAASITSLQGVGWDASVWHSAARVDLRTAEAWTSVAHGTRIVFSTTPTGSVTRADSVSIEPTGLLLAPNGATIASGATVTGSTSLQAMTATAGSFTGAATFAQGLRLTGAGVGAVTGAMYKDSTYGVTTIAATGSQNDWSVFDPTAGTAILKIATGTSILTVAGGLAVNAGTTAVQALTATTGAFSGSVAMSGTASYQMSFNTTTGATSDFVQLLFKRGGTTKWRWGTNIDGTNNDAFQLYNEGLTAVALSVASATSDASFAGALSVSNNITLAGSGVTVLSGTTAVQALTATTGAFSAGVTSSAAAGFFSAKTTNTTNPYFSLMNSAGTNKGFVFYDVPSDAVYVNRDGLTSSGLRFDGSGNASFYGTVDAKTGLTVTAGGISVVTGSTSLQALTATTGSFSSTLSVTTSGNAVVVGGDTNPTTTLVVNSASGNAASVAFQTAGTVKWFVGRGPADASDNFQVYDFAGSRTVIQVVTNTSALSLGAASCNLGFYGVTPIARALLATGAGATVDNVITALQNLGLVRQS